MHSRKILIIPSLLSLPRKDYQKYVSILEPKIKIFQFDVMDGIFVPEKTYHASFVKKIRTRAIKEAHLMVANPLSVIPDFINAGCRSIIFHYEALPHQEVIERLSKDLRKKKILVGIAINPETKADVLKQVIPFVDKILVMTVNPGRGGQELIRPCLKKVSLLRKWTAKDIEVDGGINKKTASIAVNAGANHIVIGSSLFARDEPLENLGEFMEILGK